MTLEHKRARLAEMEAMGADSEDAARLYPQMHADWQALKLEVRRLEANDGRTNNG